MRANTSHKVFPVGSTFGFAAETLHANKFMNLHIKAASHVANVEDLADDWTFTYLTRPLTYPCVGGTTGGIERRRRGAQNIKEVAQFNRFEGYWSKHTMN